MPNGKHSPPRDGSDGRDPSPIHTSDEEDVVFNKSAWWKRKRDSYTSRWIKNFDTKTCPRALRVKQIVSGVMAFLLRCQEGQLRRIVWYD